jgi:hypothetical protein
MVPPIDAAEFDAHRDLSTLIVEFLCRNKDKGFSAKEIANALGISEEDVNHAMLKLGISDLVGDLTGGLVRRKKGAIRSGGARIEDVTINGKIYYRCTSKD